jgi:hypothetical protein
MQYTVKSISKIKEFKMKKITAVLLIAALLIILTSCNTDCDCAPQETQTPTEDEPTSVPPDSLGVSWLNPVISFKSEENTVPLWNSEFALHRNQTNEYVLRDVSGASGDDIAVTADELIAGGAVRATVNIAYNGDDEYRGRLLAFAYRFFDHGRATRISAHSADPNPGVILALWQNPVNGHWFNLFQDGIGRSQATMGEPNFFTLNAETVQQISELEVFIIPTDKPTRESSYYRSGYVIKFAFEIPDMDNHFHGWELIAGGSLPFVVGEISEGGEYVPTT